MSMLDPDTQQEWARQAREQSIGKAQASAAQFNAQSNAAVAPPASPPGDSDPLNDELQAMRSVARTLEKLPSHAQSRVVSWLLSRFNEPLDLIGAGAYATQGLKGYP